MDDSQYMAVLSKSFTVAVKDLGNGNELCIVDIENIDDNLKKCLDERFVKICEGNSTSDLNYVKGRLISFLSTKRGSNIEIGAIAEFFIHLYLNEIGFEPQFLFFNLEENSIKKGFDGYYHLSGEEWILESKSGSISTVGLSHKGKIKESYDDLKDKLSGGGTNNPWREAYNHAGHIDVGTSIGILQKIKAFTVEYDKKLFHKIDDYNIIPGSTIFLEGTWATFDHVNLENEIKTLILTFNFKKIKIVCITKKSIDIFWDYLNLTS